MTDFKQRAAERVAQYQNLSKVFLNVVSILNRNVFLIKKEMNLLMNNLRYAKSYVVGHEILSDLSLPEFLDQLPELMEKFESRDIVKTLRKLKTKL